jgi:two-component system sensor histidine kinase PhoQ
MSIRGRLLLAGLVVVPLFLTITSLILDRAFKSYQLRSQERAMGLQQLLLARAANFEAGRWRVSGLDEPRLELPDSGVYAAIADLDGNIDWLSPSTSGFGRAWRGEVESLSRQLAQAIETIGSNQFTPCDIRGGGYFCFGQRVAWGSSGPQALFIVIESQAPVVAAQSAYRRQLLALSLTAAVLLLLAQWLVFAWGIRPLRQVADNIGRLERGEIDQLEGDFPDELRPLTDNLGHLLASESRRRERVRNTMDRLTHVLKSPLMLIRNSDDEGPAFRALVEQQVERMLGVVEGELARARLDGRRPAILGKAVPVKPVIERIVAAYSQLPRPAGREGLALHVDTVGVDPRANFSGDQRDLEDLFGTLLENALKYARQRVDIKAQLITESGGRSLCLRVADDGDGIPPGMESLILERGARADTVNLGHGLGLSIVIEIVSAYGGSVCTDRSDSGGACFTVTLPG